MRTHLIIAGLTAVAAATAFGGSGYADSAPVPSASAQYDFLLGEWDLEAATMQPDQSMMPGTGTMIVYPIHDGRTLQADMRVEFVDGTGFVGTTMRTYDAANENWAVSWIPAGAQAGAGAVAVWQDDRMVETWPPGQDQHGAFENTLTLDEISENRFVVSADRHYVNGPTIEGVWHYIAMRREPAGSDR